MIVFQLIGMFVVILMAAIGFFVLVPAKFWCFFGLHISNGVYSGCKELEHKKDGTEVQGMLTTCNICGKEYYAEPDWICK